MGPSRVRAASHTSWVIDPHRGASATTRSDPSGGHGPQGSASSSKPTQQGLPQIPPGLKRPQALLEPHTHFCAHTNHAGDNTCHVPRGTNSQLGDTTGGTGDVLVTPQLEHTPASASAAGTSSLCHPRGRTGRRSRGSSYLGRAGWGPAGQQRARLRPAQPKG